MNLDTISDNSVMDMITVSTEDSSLALTITVVNANPELARDIANEITKIFVQQNEENFHVNNVSVIDEAELATTPYNIHHGKDIVIFFALGVFVSLGLMLLVYMLDTTIKGPEDIEYIKMQVAGVIPLYVQDAEDKMIKDSSKRGSNTELTVLNNSKSPVTEAFRTLRTNIIYARNDKPVQTILITSPNSQEGKSYVSANLAAMFAKANKRVIIVDADMRKGRQNKIFKLSNGVGLSNCLRDMGPKGKMELKSLGKYIKNTKVPNLHVMTAGDKPSNSAELLSATRVVRLVELLTNIYDIVVFDGSPSAIVSDSIAMSKFMDQNYIVTSYKHTKLETLDKVRKAIENVGASVNGVILNKYELTKTTYSSSYYYDSNRGESLEETVDNPKSVEDLINEAVKKKPYKKYGNIEPERHINFDLSTFEPANNISTNNLPTTVESKGELSTELLNLKMENMSSEIATIKNIVVQYMMNNNNQVTIDDINSLKEELIDMKATLENNPMTEEVKDLKAELEGIKKLTEEMKEIQRNNNEKVKNFLSDYKKKKEASNNNNKK